MASELATVNIGDYVEQTSKSPSGVMIRNFFPPDKADRLAETYGRTGEWIAFFEDTFGPYPFDEYGVIQVDARFGLALETQGRSTFSADMPSYFTDPVSHMDIGEIIAGHELAHQWFGDSLTLATWQDIWLNRIRQLRGIADGRA